MTTADAFDTKPTAFEDTVFENGLYHVLAACRCVTARRGRERRDEDAVEINRQQKRLPYDCSDIFFRDLHMAFSITANDCSSLSI
jgi:hypothetical protein